MSRTTLRIDEMIKNTSGIKLLPIALSNPAHRLYANNTTVKSTISKI
jgi:hypothetical protein